jgi:PTS system mannose-specific IID component
LVPYLIYFWARWPFFWWGYKQSVKIIEDVSGQNDFNLLREAAQVLGLTVLGGFVPRMINLSLKLPYVQKIDGKPVGEPVLIQSALDQILPSLLPIALVAFCYWMLRNRRLTPVKVILIVAVITFVLGAFKIL